MAAYALLAGYHEVNCLKPLVQWNVAFFEDCANAYRELLAAFRALLEAVTFDAFWVLLRRLGANAVQDVDFIAVAAVGAVGANWAG